MSINNVLMTVKGQAVTYADLLRYVRNHQATEILQQKARQMLIDQYAEHAGLTVSDEELQRGIDAFRRERSLLKVASASEWLDRHGMNLEDLGERVRDQLLESKAAEHFSQPKVEQYYYENRLAFDTATISRIVIKEYGAARELLFRMEDGCDFHCLAREYSEEDETRRAGGYVGEMGRDALTPAEAAAVFGAQPGEVLGPIKTGQGYLIIKVEEIMSARLDESMRSRIRTILFGEWLREQMQEVDIHYALWQV
ncbi:peptidylprolyl isomerase [Paenibacillus sp. NPDC057967]|uniref:peptidylprolyl isomerase n=1 Tax=Paenibacillus sp. NPDC057967 TaxID=3346293 RepID=UPI0036D8EBA5